jgi:hypothetical protein
VKYMIMTFGDQATAMETRSTDWIKQMIQFMHRLNDELMQAGELVGAEGLVDPTQAKTVRLQAGVPVATDGPFAESKESLAGYWIVDVPDEARAIEIASRIVAFVDCPIEVRRLGDEPADIDS